MPRWPRQVLFGDVDAMFASAAVVKDPCLAGQPIAVGGPPLVAAATRSDSRLRISAQNSVTVVDIESPFGIDRARIRRQAAAWPRTIVIRAHLRGLESFKVDNGTVSVEWSASNERDSEPRVTLWRGKQETRLTGDSPYFTRVRITRTKGATSRDGGVGRGYFEIPLPARLFEKNPQEISVQWVDFYRG